MNPNLAFIDILPTVKADSRSATFKKETASDSSDSKKKVPRAQSPSAKWAFVEISGMETDSALLQKKGVAVRVDRDAQMFTEGIDQIKRAVNRVGFWMAESINTDIANALINGGTLPTWTPAAAWSETTAKPVEDLINLEAQMERDGYPYSMTDVYVNKTNWSELKKYLTAIDVADGKQRDIYGMPKIDKQTIEIPVVDSVVRKTAGMAEGGILALDRNNPAGTIFFNNDPAYAPQTISFKTVANGQVVKKEVKNFGISMKIYEDQETDDTVIKVWYDLATAVIEPYAALYDTGI